MGSTPGSKMKFTGSVAFVSSPFQVARLKEQISEVSGASELLVIAVRPQRGSEFRIFVAALEGLQHALVIWIRRSIPSAPIGCARRPGISWFLIRFAAMLTFRKYAFAGERLNVFHGFKIEKIYLGYPWGGVAETLIRKLPTAMETVLLDDGGATFQLIDALSSRAPWPDGDAARERLLKRSPHLVTVFGDLLPNAHNGVRVSRQVLPQISLRVEPNLLWIVGAKAPTSLTRGFSSLKSVWEYAQTVGRLEKEARRGGRVVQYFPHRGESAIGLALLAARGIKIARITISLEDHIIITRKSPGEVVGFPSTFFLMANLLLPPEVRLTVVKPVLWDDNYFYQILQSSLSSRLTFLEEPV